MLVIKSSELGSLPSLEMFYFALMYVHQRSFFLSRTRLAECHAVGKQQWRSMVRKLWHKASELPPPTLQKKIWKWPLPDFLLESRGRLYIGWQHVTSGTFCLRAFISLDYITILLLGRAWYYF